MTRMARNQPVRPTQGPISIGANDRIVRVLAVLCHAPGSALPDGWFSPEERASLQRGEKSGCLQWTPLGWMLSDIESAENEAKTFLAHSGNAELVWRWVSNRMADQPEPETAWLIAAASAAAWLRRWSASIHWLEIAFSRVPWAANPVGRRRLLDCLERHAASARKDDVGPFWLLKAEAAGDSDAPDEAWESLRCADRAALPRRFHSTWTRLKRRQLRLQGQTAEALRQWRMDGAPAEEWNEYREAVTVLYAGGLAHEALALRSPAECRTDAERLQRAYADNVVGLCELAQGCLDTAIAHFQAARNSFMALEDTIGEAKVLNNLAMVGFYRADFPEAERLMRRGLEVGQIAGDRRAIRIFRQNLAALAQMQGRYDEAWYNYQLSLNESETSGGDPAAWDIQISLALLEDQMGDFSGAQARLEAVIRSAGRHSTHGIAARWCLEYEKLNTGMIPVRLRRSFPRLPPPLHPELAAMGEEIAMSIAQALGKATAFDAIARRRRKRLGENESPDDRLKSEWISARSERLRNRLAAALERLDRLLEQPALIHRLPLRLKVRIERAQTLQALGKDEESAAENRRALDDMAVLIGRTPADRRAMLRRHPAYAGLVEAASGAPDVGMEGLRRFHAEVSAGVDPKSAMRRMIQCAVEWSGADQGSLHSLSPDGGPADILAEWPMAETVGAAPGAVFHQYAFALFAEGRAVALLTLQWERGDVPPRGRLDDMAAWFRPWGTLIGLESLNRRLREQERQLAGLEHQLERVSRNRRQATGSAQRSLGVERRREECPPLVVQPVFHAPAMRQIRDRVDRASFDDLPVHFQGEIGTGKRMMARRMHANGPRAAFPFVALDGAGFSDSSADGAPFGDRSVLAGADQALLTAIASADGGTFFLNNVDGLSLPQQDRWLQLLEEADDDGGPTDVRIVTASNRDLGQLVDDNRFREGLYHRLCRIRLVVPPLRERREEIGPLLDHFVAGYGGGHRLEWSRAAMKVLLSAGWPGNVRQLEDEIRRLLVLLPDRVEVDDLSPALQKSASSRLSRSGPIGGLPHRIRRMEQESIEEALRRSGGKQAEAARRLGVSRQRLYSRLKRLRIKP